MVIEFSHRAAAGIVVVMLASLASLAVVRFRSERRILWTSIGALALVIFQAILGAAVVIFELKADLVVVHLAAALSLVALLVYLRASLVDPSTREEEVDRGTARRAGFAAVSVLVLLLVGSYLSGVGEAQGAGFPNWPFIEGRLVPDLSVEITALHWFHRVLAAVVGVIVFVVGWGVIRQKGTRPVAARFAHVAVGLYAIELLIGAANVWTQSNQALNSASITLHLAVGALIWAGLVAIAAVTHPGLRAPAAARRSTKPALEGSG
jgi:heme a synthase